MRQLRRRVQIFLKQVYDYVPVLRYEAYVRDMPVNALQQVVFVYGFDEDGKIEGGYEIGVEVTTGKVYASAITMSRFFEFCVGCVPVVFGSDEVRRMWYDCVPGKQGVRRLVVVPRKRTLG